MTSGAEEPLSFGAAPAATGSARGALPPVTPPPVVDPEVLGKLMARFGAAAEGLRDSLIETWLGEVVQRRGDLCAAVERGDRKKAAQAAHALRSGSGALGARELAAECGRLEEALTGRQDVDLARARDSLEAAIDRAVLALGALRGS
ncbi:MAG: hypothetical protein JWL64_87 [Frankiales bacterium]|nr:hypothetical protein [Frankiales bacterium]